MLQREAQHVALKLNHDNFMASKGWLRSFTTRHQLKMSNLHGESATVDKGACTHWKTEVLPTIIERYEPKDIFSCDETGIFFHSVLTRPILTAHTF